MTKTKFNQREEKKDGEGVVTTRLHHKKKKRRREILTLSYSKQKETKSILPHPPQTILLLS
jgi:hypothetical protein